MNDAKIGHRAMKTMSGNNSVVAIYKSHTDAESDIKETGLLARIAILPVRKRDMPYFRETKMEAAAGQEP